jgi:phosphoglycolate phosphatase
MDILNMDTWTKTAKTGLTVVFDLDGTLVDTAPDLIDVLNRLLERDGIEAIPYDEARLLIGGGAKPMIERGLRRQGARCTAAEISRIYEEYLREYAEHIADRSRPYPGLTGALDALEQRGCRFAVCTNKLERLSVRLLDALGLRPRFKAICGQDTFAMQKPDPTVLRKTIAAAGGDASAAVMVGDSITDIATARGAGLPVIGVDFGYTDAPIATLKPDRVISHFDMLAPAVQDLFPEYV